MVFDQILGVCRTLLVDQGHRHKEGLYELGVVSALVHHLELEEAHKRLKCALVVGLEIDADFGLRNPVDEGLREFGKSAEIDRFEIFLQPLSNEQRVNLEWDELGNHGHIDLAELAKPLEGLGALLVELVLHKGLERFHLKVKLKTGVHELFEIHDRVRNSEIDIIGPNNSSSNNVRIGKLYI